MEEIKFLDEEMNNHKDKIFEEVKEDSSKLPDERWGGFIFRNRNKFR